LTVSENKVLSRIFRPKREEVAGGWRRLHNEEVDQSRMDKMTGTCSTHERDEECIQNFGR